jgi:myo-inositol 2-dehydrogenase/D-chiro-inositol 1-dehydrogenase
MRFALLGTHSDGLGLALAVAASGRHELAVYCGPEEGGAWLRRRELAVRTVGDLEEVLADPAVDAVIVAGPLADRPAQLRRALQSERHVLCVHPADQTPDVAYEAAMIRGDTGCVLLPLLPAGLHAGVARLAELARAAEGPLGAFQLLEVERASPEAVVLAEGTAGERVSLPGWDVVRAVGGEVAEVFAFAAAEAIEPEAPLLLAGRFERGGLFQAVFLPGQHDGRERLAVVGTAGRAELTFPEGWPGPARLRWRDAAGEDREEAWDAWDPWAPVLAQFEVAVAGAGTALPGPWQDEVRCLELDAAARRSVARRRTSTLEYPEATEEVGFKGTMTLVGCAVLWGCLALLILVAAFPRLSWVIVPVLVVLLVFFLLLQLLRWVLPARRPGAPGSRPEER